MEQIVFMICFLFFFYHTKAKTQKGHPLLSLARASRSLFSEVAIQTRESLKRPYFPLPGTNLIMFFFETPVYFSIFQTLVILKFFFLNDSPQTAVL